ncbi:ISWI chromatin-remodeling complex ATPase ISW2, partial [Diplocarpon rosae]
TTDGNPRRLSRTRPHPARAAPIVTSSSPLSLTWQPLEFQINAIESRKVNSKMNGSYEYPDLPDYPQDNIRHLAPRPASPGFTLPVEPEPHSFDQAPPSIHPKFHLQYEQQTLFPYPAALPKYSLSEQKPFAPRSSASSLLSQFLPGVSTVHKMDQVNRSPPKATAPRAQPQHPASSYPPLQIDTPPNQRSQYIVRADDKHAGSTLDTPDEEEIEYAKPSRSRLRVRKPNTSLKALENIEKPPRPSRKKAARDSVTDLTGINVTPVVSKRTAIRQEIATKTAAYRNRFFAKQKMKSRRNVDKVISLDTDSEDKDDVGVDLVGLSGILGDEMGLGKTLQTISLVQFLKENDPKRGTGRLQRPFLVVCPLSVLSSHTVKNHASLTSKALHGIKAEYRLILTGTPLQNNLSELWSLLHWLYPEVFLDKTNELFDTSFNLSKGQCSNTVLDNSRRLLELIIPMQRFWYTRMITKADQGLLDELFKGAKSKEEENMQSLKEVEEREAELMKMETDALAVLEDDELIGTDAWKETKAILEQTVQREQVEIEGKKSDWQKLMNLLMQLRKVCNHPYQIANAEPEPYESGDHVITASGKFIVLEKLITELVIKQKKKILIFSGFTKMLDLVEELLLLRGGDGTHYQSMRIDGSTARARRNLGIRMFNDPNSDYRVMMISTRAGGLGINLATASDVVLLDQDWNPQITLQAEARAHRIGQQNPVTIYKLVSQGTVEEQMMGRIQKKLYLSAKVTEAMEDIHTKFGTGKKSKKRPSRDDDNMPQLNTSQLMTLVRRGASAISRPEVDVNEMLSWDWETTVQKCKDQPADVIVKKDAIPDAKVDEEAERKWLSELERVESSVFDGKKFFKGARNNTNKDIAQEFFKKEDRRIGKNTTVLVDGYAISKESMNCAWGEAIPTMAGKDSRFADPKRAKKTAPEPQSHCQICIDGGELHCCQSCPRAFHFDCLSRDYQSKARGWQFNCPQHQCFDCHQGTQDAGGMLYRCRWCEKAYCEDCLDFDQTILIGNTLMEYDLLNYSEATNAFYIQCHSCTEHFKEIPRDYALVAELAEGIQSHHDARFGNRSRGSTRAGSMTDATTVDTNGLNTPIVIDDEHDTQGSSKKRKMKKKLTPGPPKSIKRERRGV